MRPSLGGGDTPFVKPNVSHCIEENHVHYNPYDYSDRYLTFIAREDGTFKFEGNNIKYSIDGGDTWTELVDGTNTPTVTTGTKIMWKASGLTNTYAPVVVDPDTGEPMDEEIGIGHFLSTGQYDVEGNIMSLVYEDDFIGNSDLTLEWGQFSYLFYNNVDLINAKNLSLPATTLSASCYCEMFSNCASLVSVPKLPATTLAYQCYSYMFDGTNVLPDCTSIDFTSEAVVASGGLSGLFSGTKVTDTDLARILPKDVDNKPCLPVATLAEDCYSSMFANCTSLTTAPVLPATTLAESCYAAMFQGCTSLTTAPQLPAMTLAYWCYGQMFQGCTSLTTAPQLPATTLAEICYSSMFRDCTSLVSVPSVLPATTLVRGCYSSMFQGCTSLTTTPELPATTLADKCYLNMFYRCTGLTTAPTVLPATTLAEDCYWDMFRGCTNLATAPQLPATTLAEGCYQHMFQDCTSLTTAPELPAATLVNNCYNAMFQGCTSLNYIRAMFTTTPSATYTSYWVSGVASTGKFVKNSAATWNVSGIHGVPNGWTVETASE